MVIYRFNFLTATISIIIRSCMYFWNTNESQWIQMNTVENRITQLYREKLNRVKKPNSTNRQIKKKKNEPRDTNRNCVCRW